jgi:hypothetical protein
VLRERERESVVVVVVGGYVSFDQIVDAGE